MADVSTMEEYHTVAEYMALPETPRVELIKGRFYDMAGPNRKHQKILFQLCRWIGNMIEERGGDCEVYPAPFDVQLKKDEDTVVQPDISVICDRDKLDDHGCVGAPDWVIEIVSPGNWKHDFNRKLNLYKDAGVREYWIVDPMKCRVIVYRPALDDEESDDIAIYGFNDRVPVSIYEDFWIDFSELDLS